MTQANFPNEATFPGTKTFCLLVKKLVRSCFGDRQPVLDLKYPGFCVDVLAEEDLIKSMNCADFETVKEYTEVQYVVQE